MLDNPEYDTLDFVALEYVAPNYVAPFDVHRFIEAQESVYAVALAELRAGWKQTHWIWFVFPQVAGLGESNMSRYFAIPGRGAAACYLGHRVLGGRLRECAAALMGVEGRSASAILGHLDAEKLRSSMTLFAAVAEPGSVFVRVLGKYFAGATDAETLRRLGARKGRRS